MVQQVLVDYRQASVPTPLQATLVFLEKLTLSPADVGPTDMEALRAAGVSGEEVEAAILICFLFSLMDRLADAFGFDVPPRRMQKGVAHVINAVGYGAGK
jgi:hypothetical protein